MAIRSRQIGWSNKSNLLYDILRELDALKGQFAVPTTTTTSTTINYPLGMATVNLSPYEAYFDLPYFPTAIGWWMKMTNDTNFPRIFSIGQYPTASQAVSIEGDTFYFWYNGGISFSYPLTSYLGQWIWVSLIGSVSNQSVGLYINGVNVASGFANTTTITPNLYIGSENAPNTYYNGLLADFACCANNTLGLENIPGSPLYPDGNTILLLFQGGDLTTQLTDQGVLKLPITGSNLVYNTDSPYSVTYGYGSTQFGAI